MPVTNILCPIDFSAGAQAALRVASRLAVEHGAHLVLAHVWYVPPGLYSDYTVQPTTLRELSEDLRHELEAAVAQAVALGARNVDAKMLEGVPWSEIVGSLDANPVDLCVIGTHGRTGLARVLLGSVAEKVIRHSPCSVLAVRPDDEPRSFTHILCPTDFSPSAEYALDLAAELVRPGGAGITVLHVIEAAVAFVGEVHDPELARDLDTRSAAALDGEVARLQRRATVPVLTKRRIGYAGAQTLAELHHDPTIDLVVMGSEGRTGIKRALIGSVAEKVVRHARCPVLVARKRATEPA